MKKKRKVWCLAVFCLAGLLIWMFWANRALEVNHYMISSERIPEAFDGFRITHLSDLHNEEFGKDNEKLLALVRDSEPDMIPVRFNNRPEVIAITLKKN